MQFVVNSGGHLEESAAAGGVLTAYQCPSVGLGCRPETSVESTIFIFILMRLYRALGGCSCGSRGFLEDRMMDIITGRAPHPARAESQRSKAVDEDIAVLLFSFCLYLFARTTYLSPTRAHAPVAPIAPASASAPPPNTTQYVSPLSHRDWESGGKEVCPGPRPPGLLYYSPGYFAALCSTVAPFMFTRRLQACLTPPTTTTTHTPPPPHTHPHIAQALSIRIWRDFWTSGLRQYPSPRSTVSR